MLTAVCAFTEHPKNLLECRAAEERAREELAAVRAAAAAAGAAGAHGMDSAVAAAATSVAKAPEPRSAVVEAELWRVCCTALRYHIHAWLTLAIQSALEKYLKRNLKWPQTRNCHKKAVQTIPAENMYTIARQLACGPVTSHCIMLHFTLLAHKVHCCGLMGSAMFT